MNTFTDLTGKTFHRLTVLYRVENDLSGKSRWLCRCECGAEKILLGGRITSGKSKSCGCLRAELSAARTRSRTKHGHARDHRVSSEYRSWSCMKARCLYPSSTKFALYGGRGIAVCARWESSFENFLADMGPKPTPIHTLDRIDPNGNYTPENCRWATPLEQRHNRRGHKGAELTNAIYPRSTRDAA